MFRSASRTLALTLLVAGCVAIPTRSEPAAYTQSIVQDAIRLYSQAGRQATIDHYSSAENVDGHGTPSCARQRIILLSTKWTRKLDITKVNYLTKTRKGRGTKAW